ncbi:hypothetical protein ASPZODRAFT_13455 [Penicilliopsis zonata CBS 506.65]|uniref:Cyanovirin-N domain-containing protein n=1 Tax=Penicilliopsis zonata CBS 506.65 TaxID=1073090 RepID=A0A1L9STD2_9EURO|nr:hypothetical protein ASPZODRAFT_13455 [Penicilliopsis zonata CBS 506.65]OJJ50371.1 hypothetical protein ASPZODRAFT_13455 [Penicilliopsis zonata CBS 506.65]
MRFTLASLLAGSVAVLAVPNINLGFLGFPSGGKFIAWEAGLSEKDACANYVTITGSDGGPAPPRCGTEFTLDGNTGLSLACLSDGSTVTGVNQDGAQVESCSPVSDEGTACTQGVELTQAYACVV